MTHRGKGPKKSGPKKNRSADREAVRAQGPVRQPENGSHENGPENETDVLFQPAAVGDLAQYPPAAPECERVRGMLRDFVDGDLPASLIAEIEVHIHGFAVSTDARAAAEAEVARAGKPCRACGLALARAEHEVVRLRDAVAGEFLPVPDEDFTSSVVSRIAGLALTEGQTPPNLTARVMQRLRKDVGQVPKPPRRMRLLAAAAVVMATGALGGWLLLNGRGAAVERSARVIACRGEVRVRAESAAESWRAVRPGSLRPGAELDVPAAGELEFVLTAGAAVGELPLRHRLLVQGPARLVLLAGESGDAPALRLQHGSADVTSDGSLAVLAASGERIEFDAGRFAIDAVQVRRSDSDLIGPGLVRLRVETLRGTARVAGVALESGRVARFEPLAPPVVESSPEGMLDTWRAAAVAAGVLRDSPSVEPVDRELPQWAGRIVRAGTERPVGDAWVTLRVGERSMGVATRLDGTFELEGFDAEAGVALVSVSPPAGSELGSMLPTPVRPIDGASRGIRRLPAIELEVDRPVAGLVLGHGAPVVGATVEALLVDELFGIVRRIGKPTRTQSGGRYRVADMPSRIEPHQRIVVLARHELWAPATRVGQVGDANSLASLASVDVGLRPREQVVVQDLPPNRSSVSVLFAIPGLPIRAVVDREVAHTDVHGTAQVLGPRGVRAWAIVGGQPHPLVRRGGVATLALQTDKGAGHVLPRATGYEPLARSGYEAQRRNVGPRFVQAHRYGEVANIPMTATPLSFLRVSADQVSPRAGSAPPHSRLFLRLEGGGVRFLGELDGGGGAFVDGRPLSLPDVAQLDKRATVVAVAPDGAVGSLPLPSDASPTDEFVLQLEEPGSARFDDAALQFVGDSASSMDGGILVEFVCRDGPLAGESFWRNVVGADDMMESLPAGHYDVYLPGTDTVIEARIEPGRIKILTVR